MGERCKLPCSSLREARAGPSRKCHGLSNFIIYIPECLKIVFKALRVLKRKLSRKKFQTPSGEGRRRVAGSGHFPWTFPQPGKFPQPGQFPLYLHGVGHSPFHHHHPPRGSLRVRTPHCGSLRVRSIGKGQTSKNFQPRIGPLGSGLWVSAFSYVRFNSRGTVLGGEGNCTGGRMSG